MSIMKNIVEGHNIPFDKPPHKFFRGRNPPSLKLDKVRAWVTIKNDIHHGAITPVDLKDEGMSHCVCPVRTADKNNGKARFVHNSTVTNNTIPKERVACVLESLLKTRNMYIPGDYAIGSDFASGYHCIYMAPNHKKYVAFALHVSELTKEALTWLFLHYPQAYYHTKRLFIFCYAALPVGTTLLACASGVGG